MENSSEVREYLEEKYEEDSVVSSDFDELCSDLDLDRESLLAIFAVQTNKTFIL
nr:MAG TPA: protein of unknown function (DUF4250) [Microviridae sp.]